MEFLKLALIDPDLTEKSTAAAVDVTYFSEEPNGNPAAVGIGVIMLLVLHDSTTFHISRNDSI
jgi:hypothetical protein